MKMQFENWKSLQNIISSEDNNIEAINMAIFERLEESTSFENLPEH